MKTYIKFGITVVFSIMCLQSYAQIDFGALEESQLYKKGNKYNTWSVTLGGGPVIYYTDVIDYTVFPSSDWKFAPTVMLTKQFGRAWAVEGQFFMADMYGHKNGRYFSGDLMDYSVNLITYFNQLIAYGPLRDRWNIYSKVGVGMTAFRSVLRSESDDRVWQVKDLYTNNSYPNPYGEDPDAYLVMGYNNEQLPLVETKRERALVVPLGFGVKYRMNNRLNLGLEVTLRNMGEDNLDANMTGADNDSYMFTSVGVTCIIGKKERRHASWTYKDFDLAFTQYRKFDPAAQRLDSLKKELARLQLADSIVSDTTNLYNESIVFSETISASVFFDFDKYNLSKKSHYTIAVVAKVMKERPNVKVKILGFCDSRGTDDYNYKLSDKRCNAVLNTLINDYGISPFRFVIDSKGESELLSDTEKLSPYGIHMVNRRVDLIMIKE